MMTDLLHKLLDLRDAIWAAKMCAESIWDAKTRAEEFGYAESLAADFKKLDEIERAMFAKVNEWDKP